MSITSYDAARRDATARGSYDGPGLETSVGGGIQRSARRGTTVVTVHVLDLHPQAFYLCALNEREPCPGPARVRLRGP